MDVAGDEKTRLEAIDDDEVEIGEVVTADCARRVSRARPNGEAATAGVVVGFEGTIVETDSDDPAEDVEDPRVGVQPRRGEKREDDRGTCENSPTKPGPFGWANSKAGLKPSMVPGAKEYSEPGK